jgi:hypothetical protein
VNTLHSQPHSSQQREPNSCLTLPLAPHEWGAGEADGE